MKWYIHIIMCAAMALPLLTACGPSGEEREAEALVGRIRTLYDRGEYRACMDSIASLRTRYPRQTAARRQALQIWQQASLRCAETDLAATDSALRAAQQLCLQAATIAQRNRANAHRDSLQIRYNTLCATIRVIHRRQAQDGNKQ